MTFRVDPLSARGCVGHAGDAVVLVVVVPGLDGPPGEAVRVAFLVQERHLGDVADSLVAGPAFDHVNGPQHFHLHVDRGSLHTGLLSPVEVQFALVGARNSAEREV